MRTKDENERKQENKTDSLSKVFPPRSARVQGPIGSLFRPWSPCSRLASASIPGFCDHPRQRIVREGLAELVLELRGLFHHGGLNLPPGLKATFLMGQAPSPIALTSRLRGRRQADVTVASEVLIVPHLTHARSYALFQRLTVCNVPRMAF